MTYVAECKGCDIKVDYQAKVSERETLLPDCQKCGKKMEAAFAAGAGFILKGTGWYKTDYQKRGR